MPRLRPHLAKTATPTAPVLPLGHALTYGYAYGSGRASRSRRAYGYAYGFGRASWSHHAYGYA